MAFFFRTAERALQETRRVQDDHQKIQAELDLLKRSVEHLKLVNISLWQIIKEHKGLQDVDLQKRIEELEKFYHNEAKPDQCVSCAKPIHIKKKRCVFCGAEQTRPNDIYHILFDK
ncbi:MAG: hypothetical protein A2511_03415 [Deltaproteobacteria bacterium RIFOXYD12_FULL_50_9]|nr:MAG: hypothetical protein A2511_03415 [Deltaproteobacteria bacterium RIFOXYD12_FULL_50_9]